MKAVHLITLVLLLSLAAGCRKLKPGIDTTVTGAVTDNVTNHVLPNVKLIIKEYSKSSAFSKPLFNRNIDSVLTNASGTYSIHFSTTGEGIEYRIAIAADSRVYQSYIWETLLKVGKDTTLNFNVAHLHTLKTTVHVNDYTNPPPVSAFCNQTSSLFRLYEHPLDTVVYFDVLPNLINTFNFQVQDDDTAYRFNTHTESFNFSGFADTMAVNFTLDPNTFTR